MSYKVFITKEIRQFLRQADNKTNRIIKNNLEKLSKNPYPGKGLGDKEKLPIQGEQRYRLHIGRAWTAFYSVLEDKEQVRVSKILPISEAHKKYGF